MTDPTFHAKIRPSLHPAAQELVAIYEAVPGALTYPGCCPEAWRRWWLTLSWRFRTRTAARAGKAGPSAVTPPSSVESSHELHHPAL